MPQRDSGFDKHPENINRNGRPPAWKRFGEVAKAILEEKEVNIHLTDEDGKTILKRRIKTKGKNIQEALTAVLVNKSLTGDIQALKLLIEQIDGKPDQTLNLNEIELPKMEIIPCPKREEKNGKDD